MIWCYFGADPTRGLMGFIILFINHELDTGPFPILHQFVYIIHIPFLTKG